MVGVTTTPRSPQDIRRLTRIFPSLQGYALLPLLVPLALLWTVDLGLLGPAWRQAFLPSWLAAVAASAWISHWYGRRFGQVRFGQAETLSRVAVLIALFMLVNWLLPAFLTRVLGMDAAVLRQEGPIAWPRLGFGLVFTVYGLWLRPAMPRFWLLGAAILLLAAMPLGDWLPWAAGRHPFFHPYVDRPLLLAVTLAYCLLSHRALTRFFPRSGERDLEETDG